MNPDANLSELLDLAQSAVRAKSNWISRCSQKHLPPAIVRRGESGATKSMAVCAEYLKRHGYHEESWANGWFYFKKGDLYLGAFRWIIDGQKIVVTDSVFDEPVSELPEKFKEPRPGARFPDYALGLT